MLALRDELASRAFDLPDAWWHDQPAVIGGRDRRGGGSWCVSDIATAATAVILNRPERPAGEPGAPSRGVLPLLAIRHKDRWPGFVDVTEMAGFNLVLVSPGALRWWSFDGRHLRRQALSGGTHMFTPHGLLPAVLDHRFASRSIRPDPESAAPAGEVWAEWLAVLDAAVPSSDPADLLVRRPVDADSYETVFGQFIAARPGALRLDYVDHPAHGPARPWTTRLWHADACDLAD